VVIDAEALADDGAVRRLEILFAPLGGPGGVPDRFLGLYQSTSAHLRPAKDRCATWPSAPSTAPRPVPPVRSCGWRSSTAAASPRVA